SYVAQAKKDHDTYVKQQSVESLQGNMASSQAQMARQAVVPGDVSDKALQAQYQEYSHMLDEAVSAGTITPVQRGKMLATQMQNNVQTSVTARINALPATDRRGFLKQLQDDWAKSAAPASPDTAIEVPGYTGKFTLHDAEAAADDDSTKPSTDQWKAA